MSYVDIFVLPVPKARIEEYKQLVLETSALWKEYGATSYVEAIADDMHVGKLTSFPRAVQATEDETVVVSWLIYPSKEVREIATKKMMDDPRMTELMDKMPTDGERMILAGFETFIGG